MKKIFVILVLLLSGCSAKENIDIIVNEDKSLNLNIIAAFDSEFLNGTLNEINNTKDKTYTDKQMWGFLEEKISSETERGYYEIQKYDNDGYKGYTFTTKIDNIDNITGDDANFDVRNYPLIPEQKLFKKDGEKYISQIYYSSISGEEYVDFDFIFEITLPYPALSNNADSVSNDGKTLSWNTASKEEGRIDFEFSFDPNVINEKSQEKLHDIKIYVIAGSIIVGIILIVGIIVIKRKKHEDF